MHPSQNKRSHEPPFPLFLFRSAAPRTPSAFGAPAASPAGGGGTFGSSGGFARAGGAFGQQPSSGTRAIGFSVTTLPDGAGPGIALPLAQFHVISAMPEYATKSLEELRAEDYAQDNPPGAKRATPAAAAFCQPAAAAQPAASSPGGGFATFGGAQAGGGGAFGAAPQDGRRGAFCQPFSWPASIAQDGFATTNGGAAAAAASPAASGVFGGVPSVFGAPPGGAFVAGALAQPRGGAAAPFCGATAAPPAPLFPAADGAGAGVFSNSSSRAAQLLQQQAQQHAQQQRELVALLRWEEQQRTCAPLFPTPPPPPPPASRGGAGPWALVLGFASSTLFLALSLREERRGRAADAAARGGGGGAHAQKSGAQLPPQ
jgi:hypothetical protein